MTLFSHGLVGAAVADLFPDHPLLGVVFGFLSHLFLDSIPHWDYSLKSSRRNSANPLDSDIATEHDFYATDLPKIALDGLLGAFVPLLIFNQSPAWLTICGAAAGMLPDALQFAYFKIRRQPLTSLQRFHQWIHSKNSWLRRNPNWGIPLQIIIIAVISAAARFLAYST